MLKSASLIFLSCLLSLFVSCRSDASSRRVVREWMGKEMIIPDSLFFTVQGDTIDYTWHLSDFRILSFIDSSGCTNCNMKLPLWEKVMSQFNSSEDTHVALLMIVESNDAEEAVDFSRQAGFKWPLAVDTGHRFSMGYSLPEHPEYRTFLLDADNRVIAIGNPTTNPAIYKLYKDVIFGDNPDQVLDVDAFAPIRYKSLGVLKHGEVSSVNFEIFNPTVSMMIVEDITTSCNCTEAYIDADTIEPGKSSILRVRHFAEPSSKGEYQRDIMLTFNANTTPLVLRIGGYIENN